MKNGKIINEILGGNRFHPYDKEYREVPVEVDSISAQNRKDKTNTHAITLIALVISIIILLILAGIVLNLALGEHGIIKMAERAGKNYVNATEEEQKKLADLLNETENIISGADKNGNSPQTLTIALEGGITHTAKQIQYTWEELNIFSKIISDNYGTENGKINNNTAEVNVIINGKTNTLGIGDWTTLGGLQVRILGFNHDLLLDKQVYGGTNNYAGISFEFVECLTTARMNSSATSAGGWGTCELRGTLNSTIYDNLENKAYVKEVNKYYLATYNDIDSVTTSQDKLWLLSCSEVWNNGKNGQPYGATAAKEGEQYKYYENINANASNANSSLIKTNNGSANAWWMRSPRYDGNSGFCGIDATGSSNYSDSEYDNYAVAPGFAI